VNEETGEQDEDYFKSNAVNRKCDGYTVYFGIEKQMTSAQVTDDYLVLLLNSKILEHQYFQGLTSENIRTVFDRVQSLKVASFSFDDFLKGECTDVDFKSDFRLTKVDLKKAIQVMKDKAIPSAIRGDGYTAWNNKRALAIQFAERKTGRYLNHPFLKVYHKGLELRTKSADFARAYLSGQSFDDLTRIETTVKNKKHFRHLKIRDTSLNGLLSLTEGEKQHIMSNAVKCHLEPRQAVRVNMGETVDQQKVYAIMGIERALSLGQSFESYLQDALGRFKTKETKIRSKKYLTNLYQAHFLEFDQVNEDNKKMDDFARFIFWN